MDSIIRDWAGKDRLFRLGFGGVLDLEEACGKQSIGAIFFRVSSGQFFAKDIFETLRLALIGGGESKVEVKRLMDAHFETCPMMENVAIAADVLIALMNGIEEDSTPVDDEPAPVKFSDVSQICREFNISPLDLRAMRYADFVNLVRGFNANGPRKATPPTEDEFRDILDRYEPGAVLNG